MRLAITSNGPGEFAGWVRPLVASLRHLAPATEVALFFVPDDYATGREADVARKMFPDGRVIPPRDYLRFALGRSVDDAPRHTDITLYLGGDLMHAARVHARLGGTARAYKFSRRRYAKLFERVYAVDEPNLAQLVGWGVPREAIAIVGNLAIDGALGEAAGAFGGAPDDPRVPPNSILIMPGARKNEIASLVPLFLQMCRALARAGARAHGRLRDFAVHAGRRVGASARGGRRAQRVGGARPRRRGARWDCARSGGRRSTRPGRPRRPPLCGARAHGRHDPRDEVHRTRGARRSDDRVRALERAREGRHQRPVDSTSIASRCWARLIKRAAVVRVDAHFPLVAQPNIDAHEVFMPELRGTLMPGYIARRVADYAADDAGRAAASRRLRELYARHAGAAERMARSLLETTA